MIAVRPKQEPKALTPMFVTLLEIATLDRAEQPANASAPMVVTLSGMVTEVRLAH